MRLPRLGALVVTALALALAGCSSAATGSTGADAPASAGATGATGDTAAAFPVTVPHAFGSTTVEKKPTRIATVAWAARKSTKLRMRSAKRA